MTESSPPPSTDAAQTRIDTLLEIACAINGELDLERLFWVIYEQCSRVFDTRNFLLITCDPDGSAIQVQVWFYGGQQLHQADLPGGTLADLSPEVIRTRQPLRVPDYVAAVAARRLTLPPPTDPHAQLAWIGVPILIGERLIGVIAMSRSGPAYSDDDSRLLQAIAAQCAVALENANLVGLVSETVRELVRRTQELASLNAIATAVNRSLDLHTVLRLAADSLLQITGWQMATIRLWNPLTRQWDLAVRRGVPDALVEVADREQMTPESDPIYHRVTPDILAGRPVSLAVGDDLDLPHYQQAGLRHLLSLPLQTRGQVLGMVVLGSTRAEGAAAAEQMLADTTLAAIGEQLAVAIESSRLQSQAQQAAALEERHRLARELHDSVTQSLFTVTLMAEAAQAMIERDPVRVTAYLERLKETAHSALAEMRALLGQLRPQGLSASGLGAALRKHAETVGGQVGLTVDVEVADDVPEMAPAVEEALYRIAQEALHNVVKHAAATHATIRVGGLAHHPGGPYHAVTLAVEDDGRGFALPPDLHPPDGGLGLTSMRERATGLGGNFVISSRPGGGTIVTVAIPVA